MEIEEMMIVRDFKGFFSDIFKNYRFFYLNSEQRVNKHFQMDRELLRRHVMEKVRKFQEKIKRINEDKEKNDKEKFNAIMNKYSKTQENLVLFF